MAARSPGEAGMGRDLTNILREAYRELRPRAAMPEFRAEFFPFANMNHTIRLRDGTALVRLSDLLEGSPEPVLHAISHILLAKLYRKPIQPVHAARYRRYVSSRDISRQVELIRQLRGRKQLGSANGHAYDLETIFEELNVRFFHGLMARPQLSWSDAASRTTLGHYDPAHNAIVISRLLDRPSVPRYVVEYLVYHEMLHLRHPVRLRGTRRCIHPPEFQREERLFPQFKQATAFLKRF